MFNLSVHPMRDPFQAVAERMVDIADKLIKNRPFHEYQREFALAVVNAVIRGSSEDLTALFSRQSGKTETMARVSVTLAVFLPALAKQVDALSAFVSGIWIGVFAPVRDQAKTAFERMIEAVESKVCSALRRKLKLRYLEKNATSRRFSNGSFIRTWPASPGANIESKTLHLAIVEEAQDVTAYKIRKSIEPMLTSTAGTLVQIGTANGLKSLFWETIERNKKLQHKEPERKLHFEYDWKTVIKHNRRYRAFLAKKVSDRGAGWVESDEFKMAYGCIFILERGQFMSFARFLDLENLGADIPRGPYDHQGNCMLSVPVVAGIDWGKSSDSTVVTIIAKYGEFCQVVDWLEIVGDDYDSQFDSIITFLGRFSTLELVLAETNGVGDPMTDRLKKAARMGDLKAEVKGFLASASNNSDGYRNLMIDMVNSNRLLFPADVETQASREYDAFAGQLTDVVKEWKGSLLKVCAPDLTGEDGEKHDDYVSSLMIAYWGASKTTSGGMFKQFYEDKPNGNRKKTNTPR